MYEPITEHNFKQVWETSAYLGNYSISVKSHTTGWEACFFKNGSISTQNFDEFLAFVQKRVELKPLPKFDFEEYINNNISKKMSNNLSDIFNCIYLGERPDLLLTKNNADILVSMSKLAEGLK